MSKITISKSLKKKLKNSKYRTWAVSAMNKIVEIAQVLIEDEGKVKNASKKSRKRRS